MTFHYSYTDSFLKFEQFLTINRRDMMKKANRWRRSDGSTDIRMKEHYDNQEITYPDI